jgi:hypothetical protein
MKRVHSLGYLGFEFGHLEVDEEAGVKSIVLHSWFRDCLKKELKSMIEELINERFSKAESDESGN